MADKYKVDLRVEQKDIVARKDTHIWLNGEEITNRVQSMQFNWDAKGVSTATITFIVDSIAIDGPFVGEEKVG